MVVKPEFEGTELYPVLPLREWIRQQVPPGQMGYVAEDLDLIILRFGAPIGRDYDADGQFILCECKENIPVMPYAQVRTFGLLDRILKQGDPQQEYYLGFYLICWDCERELVQVNKEYISQDDFRQFLMGELHIEPHKFNDYY